MQSINQHIVDTTIQALPEGYEAVVFTGADIKIEKPHELVKTCEHSPVSLISRFKCWIGFYKDVMSWVKVNRNENIGLIYAVSNPPINSFLGVKLAKIYRAKFIYMEWDIYPQIIEESINNAFAKTVCKVWHWLNNIYLPQIDKLLTIGTHMSQSISNPVHKSIDVTIIPIYTDVDVMKPIPKEKNRFRIELGLLESFVVIYSGKMGIGHNIPLILDAADRLEESYPDIKFLLIGFGPGYEQAKKRIDAGSKNIILLDPQPDDVFPYSMASGDIGIVSEEVKLAKLFLPSKSYDMMACGLPLIGICTENDDLQELIQSNDVGSIVTDNSPETLANTIVKYYSNKNELAAKGNTARKLVENKYSRENVIRQYKDVFKEVTTIT